MKISNESSKRNSVITSVTSAYTIVFFVREGDYHIYFFFHSKCVGTSVCVTEIEIRDFVVVFCMRDTYTVTKRKSLLFYMSLLNFEKKSTLVNQCFHSALGNPYGIVIVKISEKIIKRLPLKIKNCL